MYLETEDIMIELVFDESPAGALKFAKSMKTGERMNGAMAVGIIGGTAKERAKLKREAKKPHFWTGVNMEGSSADVAMVKFDLDIGDIAGTDTGTGHRREVLEMLYGCYPGVPEAIWEKNEQALARLADTKATGEPVRVWVSDASPADQCGLCFLCCLMGEAQTPLSVVRAPRQVEREADNCVIEYRGMGDIPAEAMGVLAETAQPLTALQRRFLAGRWSDLVRENAPLRANVNGRLMSVGVDFYDFALRRSLPEDEFVMAKLIGLALGGLPGVSDRWLFGRVQAMIDAGELIEVTPATGDHPYSAVLRRSV